jgi:hypothetical protein
MTGAPQEVTKSQFDTKRMKQTTVSKVSKKMVNSWELGKQDIIGKSFKKYGANDALNESGGDALCEESESSDHTINNDRHESNNECLSVVSVVCCQAEVSATD